MKRFYVLTGAPGSGKSSILAELAKRQIQVIPEGMRWAMVLHSVESYSPQASIRDAAYACHLGLQRFLEDTELQTHSAVVLDRCLIDVWAYTLLYCGQTTPTLDKLARQSASHIQVAFCTPQPVAAPVHDGIRTESLADALSIFSAIQAAYRTFGVALSLLPNAEQTTQVEHILSTLNANGKQLPSPNHQG